MHHYFSLVYHPAVLALAAAAILLVAWPLENAPALVVAVVMMISAAGITMRAHFRTPQG